MTPTPDWTIAVRKPHTSATSHRMIPSTRLSRERRWSRHDTWRYTDGPFVEDRPLAAVRRGDRHARKRPARLSQHALAWTALERPLRPGIRGVLVYHVSYTLLARLVSLGLPGGGICSPGSLYLG